MNLKSIEITDYQGPQEAIDERWPSNLTYKGESLESLFIDNVMLDSVIDDIFNPVALKELLDGEFHTEYQEVYIGYIVEQDSFILGYDILGNNSCKMFAVFFKDGNINVSKSIDNYSIFYNNLYNELQSTVKNKNLTLIDLRLD